MRVESHLNEPLKASLSLDHVDGDDLLDIRISVGDAESYQTIGLSKPSYLPKLTFKVVAGADGRKIIQVTSRQAIKEPIIEILVQVLEKQSKMLRLYTLLIDPMVNNPAVPRVAHEPVDNGLRSPAQALPAAPTKPETSGIRETIQVKDKGISLIAQDSPLHENYSVYQIMRAFYLENTDAFMNGNIGRLMSASRLIVPSVEKVAQVNRRAAVNFVYSVSKDNPAVRGTPMKPSGPVVPLVKKQTQIPKISTGLNKPAAKSQTSRPADIGPDVEEDLKTWRTMTDEFKSLATIVQKQNRVLKLHSGAIRELSAGAMADNNGARNVQRNDSPEIIGSFEVTRQLEDVQNALQNQSKVIALQGERINSFTDLLAKKSDEIVSLNNRFNDLDGRLEPSARATGSDIKAILADIPEVVTNVIAVQPPASGKGFIDVDKKRLLILLGAVIFALVCGFVWRRRGARNATTTSSNDGKPRYTGSAGQEEKQVDVNYVEQKSSSRVEHDKGVGKGALSLASVSKRKKPKLGNLIDIYTEIDIYIVYELYEEAQKLLEAAREIHADDPGLDIKELEVLAHAKEIESFFAMYEEKKDILAQKFPMGWTKISKLKDKLGSDFQLTVAK